MSTPSNGCCSRPVVAGRHVLSYLVAQANIIGLNWLARFARGFESQSVSPSGPDGIAARSRTGYNSLRCRHRAGARAVQDPGVARSGWHGRSIACALNRDVAIEVIPSSVADNPETLARFERESHAIAALSHPDDLRRRAQQRHPYASDGLPRRRNPARGAQADLPVRRESISPRRIAEGWRPRTTNRSLTVI